MVNHEELIGTTGYLKQ